MNGTAAAENGGERSRGEERRRRTRTSMSVAALAWVLGFAIVPVVLWHRVLGDTVASFHWSLSYAAGELGPWFLLMAGVAFMVPVAISVGRDPESRLYPRARRAYAGWGIVLYLLGIVLLVEVAEIWKYTS